MSLADSGLRFERISFKTENGSQILVSHDVPPAYLIPELNHSIRVKSNQAEISLMVRVVLPETPSPTGNGPLTFMLTGPTYKSTDHWQTLSFSADKKQLTQKFQEKIWLLRRQHRGSYISPNNAYIDQIALGLHCGPETTTVDIDWVSVDGIVEADQIAQQVEAATKTRLDTMVRGVGFIEAIQDGREPVNEKRKSLIVRDGTVLLIDKTPFMARIIEHQGESFEYLRSLGFNTIELTQTAKPEQLEAARQLNMWIICPPPSSIGLAPIGFSFDRVLAWKAGENLTGRNLQNVQQKIREIRESDQREGRPIVGHVATDWMRFSQELDILNFGIEPLGTSFLASQYSEWLRQRSRSAEHNKPVWADIQTDLPQELISQIRSVANVMPPTPIEPQQIQYLVYEAITGGARGLRFKSRSRLDATDPTTRLRALTLEWINAHLDRLEPWIAGGALRDPIPTDQRDLEVHVISTNRARLLLIQRTSHLEQYLAGDLPLRTISFRDPDNFAGDRALWLTDAGPQSLAINRSVAGAQIVIENCPTTAAIVLSQDSMVTQRMNQTYQRIGRASSHQLMIDLTRQWLAIMELIENQLDRMNRSTPVVADSLSRASVAFQNAIRMTEANSLSTATPYLNEANQRLAYMRREIISQPLGLFQSKTSSPLLAHVSLVPLHWELATRLQERRWNPNGLPGGDFENLDQMTRTGWENRRLNDDRVATLVQLSDDDTVGGLYALRLQATPTSGKQPIDSPPLWISTPRLPVRGGHLVRIHGWVNIPQVIRGNAEGLIITDSLGGDAMAERIPITEGWQEFTLYRGVPADTELQVTFTLSGYGTAMVDEVTIRTVELPAIPRQARTD